MVAVDFPDHVYYRWPRSTYRPIHRPIYRSTIDRYMHIYIYNIYSRSTIGRQSTDYRSIVDRLSVDSRPIDRPTVDGYIGRQSTDKCPHIGWCIGRQSVNISVDYRSTIGRLSVDYRSTISRLSVDYRSTIGRLSTDSRPIDRPTVDGYIGRQSTDKCAHIGRLSVDCRSIVDR